MKEKITIIIVNYNSADFIDIAIFALTKLTKNPFRILIIDNNSKTPDYLKLQKIVSNYKHYIDIKLERKEYHLTGSLAHGTALNYLATKIDTPYFSILDADATWLKKDWDEILISKMSDKIKVIGTQADPPKIQDFPLMFAILFETMAFRELKIDFRPKDLTKKQDTGWEMREKYLNAGYQGINIKLKNTRLYKKGPFCKIPAVGEYYFENNYDYVFASHFGRGSNPFAKKTIPSKNRLLTLLLLPINYCLWQRDKLRWLKKCKNIINNQL